MACRRQDSNLLSRGNGFTARPTSPTVALLLIAGGGSDLRSRSTAGTRPRTSRVEPSFLTQNVPVHRPHRRTAASSETHPDPAASPIPSCSSAQPTYMGLRLTRVRPARHETLSAGSAPWLRRCLQRARDDQASRADDRAIRPDRRTGACKPPRAHLLAARARPRSRPDWPRGSGRSAVPRSASRSCDFLEHEGEASGRSMCGTCPASSITCNGQPSLALASCGKLQRYEPVLRTPHQRRRHVDAAVSSGPAWCRCATSWRIVRLTCGTTAHGSACTW